MNLPALLALSFACSFQDPVEALIEQLASPQINVRTRSAADLIQRGRSAIPALQKAALHTDPEIAGRARQCLQRIELRGRLTPALLAIEGLEDRLWRGGDREWTALFLEALPGRAVPMYSRLGREDLEALTEKALAGASGDPERAEVVAAAGQNRLRSCKAAAEALLEGRPPVLRATAARALILIAPDTEALGKAEPFLKDAQAEVRIAAVETLASLGIKEAVPRLVALQGDPTLSRALASAFWQLRAKEGIPYLIKLSSSEAWDDHPTRSMAAMYLSFYAGPEVIPHMRSLLKWMEKDPNTSDSALKFLGTWGDRDSIPLIERELGRARAWGNTAHYATRTLVLLGGTSSTPSLLKLAREGHGDAIRSLGQMGSRDAVPGLRELLAQGKGAAEAAIALGELGDRESIPAIRKLLVARRDSNLRRAACTALALLNDTESAAVIDGMEEAGLARRIWPALKAIGGPDGAALPEDPKTYAGGWQISEYEPQLMEGTNSTYGFPRYLSLRGAATARAGRAPDALLKRLGKEDSECTSAIAAAALVRLGKKEGVAELLKSERLLFCLNALRRPEVWAPMEGKAADFQLYAPYELIHRRLAREAALAIEGPSVGSDAHRVWTNVHQRFRKWGRPATLAEAFEMIEDVRWSVVLEADRIRILPREQALVLWQQWWKEQGK